MILFNANIKPYTTLNECGDFYQYLELDDYFLLVVGDIGGHGSPRVYQIACEIKKIVELHKQKSIIEIVNLIHNQEILQQNGMTIFIAQVYKNLPIFNYCAIGNTKAKILRKNDAIPLHTQDGILGYDIPTSIKLHMRKISNNDILIVMTDGISFHKEQFLRDIANSKNIELITKSCVDKFGNDDDRLCVALKFDIDANKHFSIKHNLDTQVISKNDKITNIKKVRKINNQSQWQQQEKRIFDIPSRVPHKLLLLSNEKLLLKDIEHTSVKFIMTKLAHFSSMAKELEIKIKTFLYEITKYSTVDLYLDKFILQIYIRDIKQLKDSLEFLFNNFYITHDNNCMINISLPKLIHLDKEKFNALKEILTLKLSDQEYTKFKENEQNIQKIASQNKLSAMGEMIGNIAHQWRQPLSVISTAASGLAVQKEYGMLTDEMLFKSCDIINDNAQYLSNTIDDFRDFIKGDTKAEKFTLKQLIEKSLNILQSSIKENYIDLIVSLDEEIQLDGALNLLIQTIVNIINNAKDVLIERDIKNKLIFLTATQKDENIIITIKDNAGGIPVDIKDKIFDAYFTTKHQSIGTGLGLNMAYNIIVNSFKGKLEVENKTFFHNDQEFKGAMFILTLPIIATQ